MTKEEWIIRQARAEAIDQCLFVFFAFILPFVLYLLVRVGG
jgi:hypothetical protein